ncbi:uncharacterized protein IWZ02DRAFT_495166 [Phyllosticta citriasiana]|uniref:uncharacterized protein n=1 Tax=Phyllosticta citriasiana TaxID=595635 RepID=UPI0030FD428F
MQSSQCHGATTRGLRCRNMTKMGSFCYIHVSQAKPPPATTTITSPAGSSGGNGDSMAKMRAALAAAFNIDGDNGYSQGNLSSVPMTVPGLKAGRRPNSADDDNSKNRAAAAQCSSDNVESSDGDEEKEIKGEQGEGGDRFARWLHAASPPSSPPSHSSSSSPHSFSSSSVRGASPPAEPPTARKPKAGRGLAATGPELLSTPPVPNKSTHPILGKLKKSSNRGVAGEQGDVVLAKEQPAAAQVVNTTNTIQDELDDLVVRLDAVSGQCTKAHPDNVALTALLLQSISMLRMLKDVIGSGA